MNTFRIILLALVWSIWSGPPASAQNLRNITVYVQNPTSGNVSFLYRKGGDDWQKRYLSAGQTYTMRGIAPHYIRFNNGRGGTTQYRLTPGSTNYFQWSNGVLGLRHR